ncbi:MAG: sodium:solute symporter [Pirellulales bacterium]
MTDGANAATGAGVGTLAALLVFIAASVWLGTLAQRAVEKGSFLKGYFLGNRGLGAWALALTATVQSGGTFMGFPSYVYSYGWVVALWIAAYMVVPLTGFGVLGKRLAQLSRRMGAITVPDMFRARFESPAAGLMASLLILFFMSFMMVAQFKAGAIVMQVSWPGSGALTLDEAGPTGGDYYYRLGLAIFALTVVGYTLIGGFLAAVWTDLFQSVMMLIGVMILLPLTLLAAGGLPAASRNLAREVAVQPPVEGDATRLENSLPVEARMRALDAALRQYAARNEGGLPDDLDGFVSGGIAYYGRGSAIDPPGSTRRTLLALTAKEADGWQTALYSNGVIRSGKLGPPGELLTGPGPAGFHPLGMAFSFFFVWVFAGMGSPAGMVRVMACKDTRTIRRSIFLLACYNMLIYISLIVICICGRTLLPDLQKSDEIIPRLALMSTGDLWGGSFIGGLILAAPFGAVMATVSSYLVVIASGLVRDVYQRFINPAASETTIRWLSYFFMVLVGTIAVVACLWPPDYLQSVVVFSGTCGAATFVVPALMAVYWRRATAAGAMAAMGAGVAAVLSLYSVSWLQGQFKTYPLFGIDPIVWGLAASLIVGIIASLASQPPSRQLVSKLFDAPSPGR